VSTVYACRARPGAEPKGADDAQEARWYAEADIPWDALCFDHAQILRDYFTWVRTGERRKLWP
jgi:8-oxo-dGTP diphosphatase